MIFFEIVVIAIVIVLQFVFFFKSLRRIRQLSWMFPDISEGTVPYLITSPKTGNNELVFDEENKIFATPESNKEIIEINKSIVSDPFIKIIDSTNKYLKNNSETTAEFDILQNICERISEAEEQSIITGISLPLYIGLMGTFVGVIIGIFNLLNGTAALSVETAELAAQGVKQSIEDPGIRKFLIGVLIAMSGSFMGLLLTTINNSYHFKNAKGERDSKKNDYLNFLQAELLPTMQNTLSKNLKDLGNNLDGFNKEFSSNIDTFKGTIPGITENLKLQTEFIKTFSKLDIPRIANANIKVFEKIDESAKIFKGFNNYAVKLNDMVSGSVELAEQINKVLNRFSNIEQSFNDAAALIKQNDDHFLEAGGLLVEKLNALRERYNLISQQIDRTDEEVKAMMKFEVNQIQGLAQKLQSELEKSFDFNSEKNIFNKLMLLDNINKNMEKMASSLNKNNQTQELQINHKIIYSLNQIANHLDKLNRSIRPSIFRPAELYRFIFLKNGYGKVNEEGK